MTRPRALVGVVTACLALVALACVPESARAAVVDPPPNGYTVKVRVTFTGNGVPGGHVTRSVRVAPSCWWSPAAGNYTDATAMLAWYDEATGGLQTPGIIADYGPRDVWQTAADQQKAGHDVSWYKAYCKDPNDYTKFGINGTELGEPVAGGPQTYVTFLYRTYPAAVAPPAPRVSPEELARVAYAQMRIPKPVTDRNPKVAGSPGAPTLVDLPTWFWVTNPLAVGPLQVTAAIGPVWATVTAKTAGLDISSHYGDKHCDPKQALVSYPAPAGATPCTVVFTQAAKSLGVQMLTTWNATWTGPNGPGDTPLATKYGRANEQVAVAEVQNVVTR